MQKNTLQNKVQKQKYEIFVKFMKKNIKGVPILYFSQKACSENAI